MSRLTKSSKNKLFYGVCSGIAEHFDIHPLGVRILFISLPASVVLYFILAFHLPEKHSSLY
ncbi:PspC domain-containing protein [Anaerobacillus sp. CMMVII]|nr:PspC domain-containing protein [Anaerobacillus sp. CMMVII]